MTQPPYGDPNQPESPPPGPPYGYPPPVDPFATTPPPASPPAPPGGSPWVEPTSGGGYPTLTSGGGFPPPSPYPPPGPGPAYIPPGQSPAYIPPGQSPAYIPPGQSPGYTQPGQASPPAYGPGAGYPPPPGYDPSQAYPQLPPPAPAKRRGLLITAIVLGVALLLCGGGGTAAYLFLKDADGQGAQSPQVAVNDFLVAVYTDQDAAKAEKLVCSDARDRAELSKKIDEVKSYAGRYKDPKFSWPEPTVAETKTDSAKVNVKVKITTSDEKIAEQQLNFTVVKKTGWFVCEVQSG